MNTRLREELKDELLRRGFRRDEPGEVAPAASGTGLVAPNATMIFDSSFDGVDICDFLDAMVVRREKAFRAVPAIGREAATQTYDDAILVIDAVKAVIRRNCRAAEDR